MQHTQFEVKTKKSSLLLDLLILTLFFIFLEISFFIQGSEIYLGDFKLVSNQLNIPVKALAGIFYFLSIQLLLHLVYISVVWVSTRLIKQTLNLSWRQTDKLGMVLWFLGIVTILLANQYFFPSSKFSGLVSYVIHPVVGKFIFFFFLFLSVSAAVAALWKVKKYAILLGMGITGYYFFPITSDAVTDGATKEKPNIILIGIDAARPDFLGYFDSERATPHIDDFLKNATVFSDAYTPIARTFPAWMSVLSGQYPKKSGIRFDLQTLENSDIQKISANLLPNILRNKNYRSVFATDESRFSNIDQQFGFDEIVTPPIGLNDFLLGTLNDFPLSNLLVNTTIGQYLFPHSYGNRPAFITYDPNSFLNLLKPALQQPRDKPLFLAVHFCLTHYPYVWGRYRAHEDARLNYQAAIQRVDQQLNDFLKLLKQNKLLEHSIVVLLSDHGEGLELTGDRVTGEALFIAGEKNKESSIPHFYPPSIQHESVDKSAGHGTDVLGLTQYRTVLAFRLYGLEKNVTTTVSQQTSLLDIKPTILDFISSPQQSQKNDGYSLKNIILGKNDKLPTHLFFIESDYSPQSIRSVHPEMRNVLLEGLNYVQINPDTTRISIKKSMADLIISSKQYAVFNQDWILALYPQNKTQMMPILVNLRTGQWTNDLVTVFAQNSPAINMLQALKTFYGNDIKEILVA